MIAGISSRPADGSALDLTSCDREPIRVPGAIQPQGVLLVLRSKDLSIVQVSANTAEMLGIDAQTLVGKPLSELLGVAQTSRIGLCVEGCRVTREQHPDAAIRVAIAVRGRAHRFDASIVQIDPVVLLELEPSSDRDALSLSSFQAIVRQTLSRVRGATTVRTLAQAVAEQMRVMSGYDRVWVYRFHPDWHGEIIAESKREGIDSWLGMHYPASDIPAQARELFVEHPLRVITNVDYVPVPLVPVLDPESGTALDLSASVLRSASPIHRQYMRNMGVHASLVVSLVKDGVLWGLVSGHSYAGPRTVPRDVRTVCEFLGQAFSVQLALADAVEERDQSLRTRSVMSALLGVVVTEADPIDAILGGATSMLELSNATGAAVVMDGRSRTSGRVPGDREIRAIVEWLDGRPGSTDTPADDATFCTTQLSAHLSLAAAFTESASGLLACRLGTRSRGNYLLWFRGERRQVIAWAGDPAKPMSADDPERLSPRGSFALWEEEVRGTCDSWHESIVDAARILSAVMSRVVVPRELASLEVASDDGSAVAALTQLARRVASPHNDAANAAFMERLATRIEAFIRDLDDDLPSG